MLAVVSPVLHKYVNGADPVAIAVSIVGNPPPVESASLLAVQVLVAAQYRNVTVKSASPDCQDKTRVSLGTLGQLIIVTATEPQVFSEVNASEKNPLGFVKTVL